MAFIYTKAVSLDPAHLYKHRGATIRLIPSSDSHYATQVLEASRNATGFRPLRGPDDHGGGLEESRG